MNNVPEMISTKDLSYICDMFNWNLTACKKAYHFSGEVTDEEIGEKLDNIYQMHKDICSELLNIIEGGQPYNEQ